jgi:hypothetical protein
VDEGLSAAGGGGFWFELALGWQLKGGVPGVEAPPIL